MAAEPAVQLQDVEARYGERVALEDLTLDIPRGSLVAVFGPNGGGKSTLLKVVAGLLEPSAGTVRTLGEAPGRSARHVAYVTQAELVDWSFPVCVWDVAMMGLYPSIGPIRRPNADEREAVRRALDTVGMLDLADVQIGSLSGGQRRRAFLARALAANPDLYLLDEPVTGVDVTTQEELMAVLRDQAAEGRTIVATTHDLAAAAQHFTTVIALNRSLIAAGPASLVLNPDVLSRTYGGHILVIDGGRVVLDDAHHHDAPSGSDQHFHDDVRER